MTDLNDLFKIVAEGKKDYEENNPKGKIIKEVKDNVKSDLSKLFEELASLEKQVTEIEEQHKETLDTIAIVEATDPELNTVKIPQSVELPTPEENAIGTKYAVDRYLKTASFQQPDPDTVSKDVDDIRAKIKFLEQAIGRIAATGPGSGEVNFRYLDDVNRSTLTNSNDNWVLEYDSATGKVQFTENIGPVRTLKLNTSGRIIAPEPGMVAWNPEEDCLDVYQTDGTKLQVGLEQYIRVKNNGLTSLTNGTVVMFAGVENANEIAVPITAKYIADSTASPLFLIGVLTGDIAAGGVGRATTFGYVRDLNTTGSLVGETWVQGDLLWGHPTIAGALTKVRPTAPNVATSIAAVARVGTTDGQLLVRPTIWPRLYYGDWYDDANQTALLANTAYAVKVNHQGPTSGFTVVNNQDIKALNAGRYNFEFSLQLTSSNSSLARVWIWYRKNGQDVPNSATVVTIRENGGKLAPAWNFPVLMNANDTFTLMWATESTNVSLAAEAAGAFHPSIPSVILTVSQTNL